MKVCMSINFYDSVVKVCPGLSDNKNKIVHKIEQSCTQKMGVACATVFTSIFLGGLRIKLKCYTFSFMNLPKLCISKHHRILKENKSYYRSKERKITK